MKILINLENIKAGNLTKVNYCSDYCIITNHSGTPLPAHEKEVLERMEHRIIFNDIEAGPTTKEKLCQKLQQVAENHYCDYCKPSLVKEDSSSGPFARKEVSFSDEDKR